MNNKIKLIILPLILISISTSAQVNYQSKPYEISFGKGNSLYKDIKSEQVMLFFKLSNLSGNIGRFSYESDINIEYITEEGKTIYLIGSLPMLRYDLNLLDHNFFIKGGIGVNYINRTEIGRRNLGGHFIFSDMIGVGTQLFDFENIKIEFTYLFRHISNAGIYKNNEGYNSQYFIISFVI